MEYNETKLIVFIQTFSKKELDEFEKFLISPYFKLGRDLMPLFRVIIRFHPDFQSEEFTEKNIFKEIYPGTEFGNKKSKDILKTLSSSLLKMAEEFMVISNLNRNRVLKNRIMLEELLDRDLVKYYEKYRETAEEELNFKDEISGQIILEKYFLEAINTRYLSVKLDHLNYLKKAFKSGEYLTDYFIINLLRVAKLKSFSEIGSNIKSEGNITDLLLAELNMEEILKAYKDSPHYVFIGFHYFSYLCLINKCDTNYYSRAKEIFYTNKSKLSRLEKFFFYSDLLNIQNIGYQFVKFTASRTEIYELLVSCIEDGAYKFYEESYMQPGFYRNFILSAIYFKEFDMANKFIEKYSEELNPVYRKNMKYYSKAMISFGKADYEEALVNISKVKYDLVNFKVDVKMLSLKIYFELKLTEQAYSMADTFKHNLKTYKDIPKELNVSYFNFIKYYIKLLNLINTADKEEAMYLKNEVEKERLIAQKNWLIEKFTAL